jgi:hypothetical protein
VVERHVTHHAEVGQEPSAAALDDAILLQVVRLQDGLVAEEVDGQLAVGVDVLKFGDRCYDF